MGLKTVALFVVVGLAIVSLAAVSLSTHPILRRLRPAFITALLGCVILEAYAIAFTLTVEAGGQQLARKRKLASVDPGGPHQLLLDISGSPMKLVPRSQNAYKDASDPYMKG